MYLYVNIFINSDNDPMYYYSHFTGGNQGNQGPEKLNNSFKLGNDGNDIEIQYTLTPEYTHLIKNAYSKCRHIGTVKNRCSQFVYYLHNSY